MSTLSRDEWLALRNTGIGGSDAGTVLGVNPYKTPLELYLEKRGEITPEDISSKEAVHFGNVLEDVVAAEYSRRTGRKVERCTTLQRHPQHSWMLGNLDRLVWEGDKRPQHKGQIRTRRILECKTALGRYLDKAVWGPDGTDEVPLSYLAQCQHYMAVTGAEICDLAVMMAGPEFRIYTINRDDELIASMIEQEGAFWDRVQTGAQPEPDYEHATTGDLLARLYPGTDGGIIELPDSVQHWHAVLQECKSLASDYDKQAEIAKNHLKRLMGNAAIGKLPDGSAYTRKIVTRKPYEVSGVSYIDFRFTKSPKEAA